jgi:hypothetical protein
MKMCEDGWICQSMASVLRAGVSPSPARRFQAMVRKEFHSPADRAAIPSSRAYLAIKLPMIRRLRLSRRSVARKAPAESPPQLLVQVKILTQSLDKRLELKYLDVKIN